MFSRFVRWRGHRGHQSELWFAFLYSEGALQFSLCRWVAAIFADSVDLDVLVVDATREGGLSLSISAIALVFLSLSAIVPLMSSPSLVASRDFCHVTFFSNVWGGVVDLFTLALECGAPWNVPWVFRLPSHGFLDDHHCTLLRLCGFVRVQPRDVQWQSVYSCISARDMLSEGGDQHRTL